MYVFVFLLCRCLLEDAGKRDYCGLMVVLLIYVLFMPLLLAMYAYAVGNMDVQSVDTLHYLLFHLLLRSPTFSSTPPSQVFFPTVDKR